ncbi:MAG TPA: Coenzyme F420 hydrogenase/dehydrogenase, beta subunit C-terminal domain, partial [Candidatus Sumerlaeota bacterium]|nr:Coenzyme F420 hydrogenase/dehydrogenase, beta subunit C-terminal domain [Candidatus Sumerlaeota bacterium]
MARGINNIQDVPAWQLCMGCGACHAACRKNGVHLVNIESEGIRPLFRPEVCDTCTDCLSVCPGYRVDVKSLHETKRTPDNAEREFGKTLEIWEGYATDPEVRYRGSSGGLISMLTLYCIEKRGMSFALHTGMDESRPWLNRTVVSRTREEVLARTGSRYAPASPCEGLEKIAQNDGPCVFVGKPCDVAGAYMLAQQNPALHKNLGLSLSFCCAGTPSTRGTLDWLDTLQISPNQVESLNYRGEGWPGGLRVRQSADSHESFVPYAECWGKLTSYVCWRCRLCPDGLGRLSDITCGDAWQSYQGEPDGQAEDSGRSIVLVRTERGREILHGAMEAGYITLNAIGSDDVLKAQVNLLAKRKDLFGRLLALRLFRIPIPRYEGFSLFASWLYLPFLQQVRSVLGTVKRIVVRK